MLEVPRRGPARLLRSIPAPEAPWLPGTPAAEAGPATEVPDGLAPVAAFDGRRSLILLNRPDGPVGLDLLVGKLRAVANEEPVARLWLSGPPGAVLRLAEALAPDLHLLPPAAMLAEAGRALARGEPPRPRRRGPAALDGRGDVEAALIAATGHLLEVLLHHAPGCRLGAGPEAVHQGRVALRRLRSVLKALRPAARCPALAEFDARLKGLADQLGPARDWDVFLAGLGAEAAAAIGPDRRIAALLRTAEARREAAYGALRQALDGPGFPRLMLAGQALLLRRPWRDGAAEDGRIALLAQPLPAFAAPQLARRWQALRRQAETIADHGPEALHEVRLAAKRLRYLAELFAPVWPGKAAARAARRFLRRLASLQEALGLANDASVARVMVASLGTAVPAWAAGAVEGFAVARATRARRRSLEAWEALAAAEPFWPDE